MILRRGIIDGLSDVVMVSVGGVGERWMISSKMDRRLAGWYTGMYFLRKFLFLSVCLLDVSVLMRY